jgi:hypothetical protein
LLHPKDINEFRERVLLMSNSVRHRSNIVVEVSDLDLTDAPPTVRSALLEKKLVSASPSSLNTTTGASGSSGVSFDDEGRDDVADASAHHHIFTLSPPSQVGTPQQTRNRTSSTMTAGSSTTRSLSEAEISLLMRRYFSITDVIKATT